MKHLKINLSTAFVLLGVVLAQAQIVIDGEFRTKLNVENSYKTPALEGQGSELFVDQRSRVRLNYANEAYQARFTLQDARVWGGDDLYNKAGTMGNSGALGVYEAWVNIFLSDKSQLKIGRQEWNYYDMRLLASRNWWTSGTSYDGLLYQYADESLTFDLGLSYNNDGLKNGLVDNSTWNSTKLKTLNFATANKSLTKYTSLAWMSLVSGKQINQDASLLVTATHGLLFFHNTDKKKNATGMFASASAYYQHGSDLTKGSDGHYKKISAYMLNAQLGLRLMEKKLEISAHVEHLSGRDYTQTDADYNNVRHSFDLHNGGRFPYYGGNQNHFILQDSYLVGSKGGAFTNYVLKAQYQLSKKSIVDVAWHMPQLSSKVAAHLSIDPITNRPVGTESLSDGQTLYWQGSLGNYVDVTHTYKFSKELILKSGFSYGLPTDIKNQMAYGYKDLASKQLYDLETNYYAWLMLIVKPTFLKL